MTSYPTLPALFEARVTGPDAGAAQIEASIKALAQRLATGSDSGRLQIRVTQRGDVRYHVIDVPTGQHRSGRDPIEAPDFAIALTSETWTEIANGDLSPVNAYLQGRMEVRGDLGFVKRQYAKAARAADLPIDILV